MYRSVYQASLTAFVAERTHTEAAPLSPDARKSKFLQLYDSLSVKVAIYIRIRGYAAADQDNLIQKIFETAWRRFDECTFAEDRWNLWIFQIAENVCREEITKIQSAASGKKGMNPPLIGKKSAQNTIRGYKPGDALYARLEAFIAALPEQQRQIFLMRMNDFTYDEIGSAIKITAQAARKCMLVVIDAGYAVFADFPGFFL